MGTESEGIHFLELRRKFGNCFFFKGRTVSKNKAYSSSLLEYSFGNQVTCDLYKRYKRNNDYIGPIDCNNGDIRPVAMQQ